MHVGRTTLIENVAPSVSGPTRKDGINFYKNNYPNGSQTVVVSFTASDAHSSISVDDMQILKNYPAHYITHSHPTHQGGNNYQYTVTIPHDGKGLTYEEEYWGYTTVRVYDSHGNYSDLTTEYYGEHIDNILPVISNNFCSAFNFTPSTADSLSQQLTFRATDNDTSQSPTVSVIKGSGVHSASSPVDIGNGYYRSTITVNRPSGYTSSTPSVTIEVRDRTNNLASLVHQLAVSHVDDKSPTFGSISGNSQVAFVNNNSTTSATRNITIPASDLGSGLDKFTVVKLNNAKGTLTGLTGGQKALNGTGSDTISFGVQFSRALYSLETEQTEQFEVTCHDRQGRTASTTVSIVVKYDDVAPVAFSNNAATHHIGVP